MSEITILTPRGVELSATFINPVDTGDAAVLFSHSVLADRRSIGHFRKATSVNSPPPTAAPDTPPLNSTTPAMAYPAMTSSF